jgi:aminoglycoside phosphotransferase family enzyme/gluconate kinase
MGLDPPFGNRLPMVRNQLTDAEQERLVLRLAASLGSGDAKQDIITTHCSRLLFCPDEVLKFKRPLDLGFLDYATYEQRLHCCREELRINRRSAETWYLGLTFIGGSVAQPTVHQRPDIDAATQMPVDVAVRMRRFPEGATLAELADAGRLTDEQVDSLAASIVALHAHSEIRRKPEAGRDFAFVFSGQLEETLRAIADLDSDLVTWCRRTCLSLQRWIGEREAAGMVREGHGDLHLANAFWDGEQAVPFDAIDFDDELRFGDVMLDLAFAFMDLRHRCLTGLAWRLLNRYIDASGDFDGLRGLRLFTVYRAAVRAKIAQLNNDPPLAARYIETAHNEMVSPQPTMVLMFGLSGSGKSVLAQALALRWGAIVARSDVERRREHSGHPGTISYRASDRDEVYDRLRDIAAHVLEAGYNVVVDATFLDRAHRESFSSLAAVHRCPITIVCAKASLDSLRKRVRERSLAGHDPSQATVRVLDQQLDALHPLDRAELDHTIVVRTDVLDTEDAVESITNQLLQATAAR